MMCKRIYKMNDKHAKGIQNTERSRMDKTYVDGDEGSMLAIMPP
jgi:hypothetical protein